MAVPLQYGDPPRLGGFAVQARLSTAPAGLVYLGQAADGRAVSIALLTRGAALDPSARERFVTAIRAASGRRGWVARARNRGAMADGPPVVEADLGQAPWVAVPYVPGRPGAERFLEPVLVGGTLIGEVHGPDFVPYWLADRAPALPAPPRPRAPLTETRARVLVAAGVLALLVVLGAVIALLLFGGDDDSAPLPRPLPPTEYVPSPPPVPVSPEPQNPRPSPSPGDTGGNTPGQTPGDENGEGNPI
ncbi:hypothetical protein [Nonomuraea sp. NPDC003804]|uniref:hypothetical protein n=1 Tax=Nonomuraea sp. NPDC003804 TaxID=3154547 RepID=UPI0033AD8B67